jgi:RNA polymerase sigma-70 factor (ECF subfamily)
MSTSPMQTGKRAGSMERMDDNEIIRRAQAGDKLAFGALFDAYYPCVYRYLQERLGGSPEAEDLCQEVFLKVLGSIDEYPRGGQLRFDEWLLRVANRLASEQYRKRSRQRRRQPDTAVSDEISVPPRLNPAAVALLSAQQREIVGYRYQAGLSVQQTAAALRLDALMVHHIERAALQTWLQCAPPVGDTPDHN